MPTHLTLSRSCLLLAVLAFGCGSEHDSSPKAGSSPSSSPVGPPADADVAAQFAGLSVREFVGRGEFEAARRRLADLARAEAGEPGESTALLAMVDALGFGRFDESIEALSASWAQQADRPEAAPLARMWILLASLDGRCADALAIYRDGRAAPRWTPGERASVLRLIALGSVGLPFAGEDEVARELLELDPIDPGGLAIALRLALVEEDLERALDLWRRIHLADPLDGEFCGDGMRAVENALRKAAAGVTDWARLAIAFSAHGFHDEARVCGDRARAEASDSEALDESLARARRFAEFRSLFVRAWRGGLRVGFANRGPQQALIAAQAGFARALMPGRTVGTDLEIFAALRDEYHHALLPDWGHPIMPSGMLAQIVDDRPARRTIDGEAIEFERVVTGRPLLDLAAVWDPLLGASKAGAFAPWWPDALLLNLPAATAVARRDWQASREEPERAPARPSDLEPDAPPLSVVSAFGVGNQGRGCFERRWELARRLAVEGRLEGQTLEASFQRVLLRDHLDGFELHELQHLADRRAGRDERQDWSRARSEFRAFLATLRFGGPLSRFEVLGRIATGGDAARSSDPYELANYDLLAGVIRALYLNPAIGAGVERERNLQAQLDRLEPEEIGRLADWIWESEFADG